MPTDETDNFPTVIGRPVFDTEPCQAPAGFEVRAGWSCKPEPGFAEPEYIRFPGGDIPVPEPTRAALLLSAKQWATRAREDQNDLGYVPFSVLDRLDAVLAELAAMEAK